MKECNYWVSLSINEINISYPCNAMSLSSIVYTYIFVIVTVSIETVCSNRETLNEKKDDISSDWVVK